MADEKTRRMDEKTATTIHVLTTTALDLLRQWEVENPQVADYRVTESGNALSRAFRLTGYLKDDIDPEGDAARAEFAKRMGY